MVIINTPSSIYYSLSLFLAFTLFLSFPLSLSNSFLFLTKASSYIRQVETNARKHALLFTDFLISAILVPNSKNLQKTRENTTLIII